MSISAEPDMPDQFTRATAPKTGRLTPRRQRLLFRLVLIGSDALMLGAAFGLAYWFRFVVQVSIEPQIVPSLGFYRQLVALLIPLWILIFAAFRLYDYQVLLGGTEEYARLFNATLGGLLVVVAATFVYPQLIIARGWLLMAWLFGFLLTASARFSLRRVVYWLRGHGYFLSPALIVGCNEEALALAQQLLAWKASGLDVVGFVDDNPPPDIDSLTPAHLPILGNLAALPMLVKQLDVEEVVVASSAVSPETLLELYRDFGTDADVNLRLSSGLFDVITTGLRIKSLGYVPLISVDKVRLSSGEAFMKGVLDVVGALFLLVVLSPLLVLIALAVKRSSPGPIIYPRRVLGRGGVPFDAYKFRTMLVDGDKLLSPQQAAELQTQHKLRDDPRITRVGRFLRRYSLDELPQLVNVLRGQMSLIGPRMITEAEKEKYGKWDMNLLTVKPGLSGLWQVSGRSDIGYDERVRLDMYYIRNYTIWLDIYLIIRTIGVVIKGKGAY